MDDWDRDCEQAIEELWQDIRTAAEARALRTMLPALRQVLAVGGNVIMSGKAEILAKPACHRSQSLQRNLTYRNRTSGLGRSGLIRVRPLPSLAVLASQVASRPSARPGLSGSRAAPARSPERLLQPMANGRARLACASDGNATLKSSNVYLLLQVVDNPSVYGTFLWTLGARCG